MKNETIICIGNQPWHSLWRNYQQIMSRIAEQNRVFFFESGRRPGQNAVSHIIRRSANLIKLNTEQVSDNLILIPPQLAIPLFRQHLPRSLLQITTPLIAGINVSMLIRQVRRTMTKNKITNPILWLYDPFYFHMVGQFGEKLSCYYNYDEFADFPPNVRIREVLRRADDCLSSRVDLVFASSDAQCKQRKKHNPNTYFIPPGVDFDLFNRALSTDLPLPHDIARLPRPILGFAGWLGWHIDVHLLLQIAGAYPDFSLVLVGPDELPNSKDAEHLRNLPNVFFLGKKDRTELPGYLKAFDVALMPWLLTEYKRSSYPLKLHEYLAAGRSIVATVLPELVPFSHLIRIAQTHEEFISRIHEALEDHDPAAVQARVAMVRENTWDHRIAEIHDILDRHLPNSKVIP